MGKNILKVAALFIIGMVGGIFADQIFWPYFVERPLFFGYRLDNQPIYINEQKEVIIQENVALQDAVEKVKKIVVGVRSTTGTGVIFEGSALIVSADGLLATFSNLAPQGSKIELFWDGQSRSFQVLKRDQKENLVLIKMEESDLPTAGFADLERLRLGSRIFLAGVVFNAKKLPISVVNEGVIRSIDGDSVQTTITDGKIVAGSPVFDIEGKVLGLSVVGKNGEISALSISKIKSFIGL